ncbi:MAG: ATP-binding protein, partial [Actinomycetes bacterium]
AALRSALDDTATTGAGRTVLVTGPPGSGKTALLGWLRSEAARRGWRSGAGAAATIEGAWPYAPVLEALADLCRAHPALLDGLDDRYRGELVAALALRTTDDQEGVGHQRLFVATGALLGVAAASTGVLLLVDDAHDADDASLRLLHYLARGAHHMRVVIVVAHRGAEHSEPLEEFRSSVVRRPDTLALPLGSLDEDSARALARAVAPGLAGEQLAQVCELAGGLPFAVTELARAAVDGSGGMSAGLALTARLATGTRDLLARVAVVGNAFDTDEFVALSGLPDELAYARLRSALAGRVLERTETGYRFRHALLREDLLAALPPERLTALHRDAADRLAVLGASPARVGHHLVAAGAVAEAVPHLLAAARTETTLGAYRDALALLEQVRAHATGRSRAEVAVLRGDLLAALGDRGAVEAYREAVRASTGELQRRARAGLARAATYGGDMATGADALEGLELNGGPNDAAILLAQGNLFYFSGDLERAWDVAEQARALLVTGDEGWQLLDLVSLQGLVAHNRGEWFERLTLELQQGRHAPQVAAAVFDSHLCVAEYLLYGPTPYARVLELARTLRATAQRAGVLRGVAFASALLGEAGLLSGDLDLAETELTESAELHRDIGARAGEAHCLQRLAEVHLARGDRARARQLCEQALPLARWSAIAMHLVQRIYGTLIASADDPTDARDLVHRAEATIAEKDFCSFCSVMLAVPAATACADAGDLPAARRHLTAAQRSVRLWEGTAWQAGLDESRAHLAAAEEDLAAARRLVEQARGDFTAIGQPIDAARCAAYADRLAGATAAAPT